MIGDLPEIQDFFNDDKKEAEEKLKVKLTGIDKTEENEIQIYLSKNKAKWYPCGFVDFAPSRIGVHLLLPSDIDFEANELENIYLKFEKIQKGTIILLKEMSVLLRWHEKDPESGRIKIGLHFHGGEKNDTLLNEILDKLKDKKKT
jgi:hypothetical protein